MVSSLESPDIALIIWASAAKSILLITSFKHVVSEVQRSQQAVCGPHSHMTVEKSLCDDSRTHLLCILSQRAAQSGKGRASYSHRLAGVKNKKAEMNRTFLVWPCDNSPIPPSPPPPLCCTLCTCTHDCTHHHLPSFLLITWQLGCPQVFFGSLPILDPHTHTSTHLKHSRSPTVSRAWEKGAMWLLFPAAVGCVDPTSPPLPKEYSAARWLGIQWWPRPSGQRPWAAVEANKTSGRYCLPQPENLSPPAPPLRPHSRDGDKAGARDQTMWLLMSAQHRSIFVFDIVTEWLWPRDKKRRASPPRRVPLCLDVKYRAGLLWKQAASSCVSEG